MTTAFVLSGGANLGAAQAGTLAALGEAGIRPDLIVAPSVGAVNGAWIAGEGDTEDLLDVWRDLRRSDVFPAGPVGGLLGFLEEATIWSATAAFGGSCALTFDSRTSRAQRPRSMSRPRTC